MRRGTIVLGERCETLSPTFVDCGTHDLLVLRLLASFVDQYSHQLSKLLRRPARRYAGDMAVSGRGEIFQPG
jgi:formylmethanofuran dehydrogenase subunit C